MADSCISVLLPTYDPGPVFFREAVESLLRQTEQRWTCVIRDDPSSTDVRALAAPFLSDPRIRFVSNEKRLGIGANWNACLREADAPFVQFLFQDDVWDSRYLASMVKVLESNPSAGFAAAEHSYACEEGIETACGYGPLCDEKRRVLRLGLQDGKDFLHRWLERGLEPNLIGEPCFVMMRRSVTDRVGLFNEELVQLLDVEYWVRMLGCADWYYLPEPLGMFRVHRKGASFRNRDPDVVFRDRIACLRNITPLFTPGTPEALSIQRHSDHRFAEVVSHIVNKLLRFRRPGKGTLPFLRYFARHPSTAIKAVYLYLLQAGGRWWRKIIFSCTPSKFC